MIIIIIVHLRETNVIPGIINNIAIALYLEFTWNPSALYLQQRLREQSMEVFTYPNGFITASANLFFGYGLNYTTRNNGAKLILKPLKSSLAQHFDPIKITTTRNALLVYNE